MNKKRILLISIFFVLLISILTIVLYVFFNDYRNAFSNGIDFQTEAIGNCYNNSRQNDYIRLFRTDNKLYYTYAAGIFSYGTYEIGEDYSRRIAWTTPSVTPDTIDAEYIYNGKILAAEINDKTIEYLNTESGKFEPYINIELPIKIESSYDLFYFVTGDRLYIGYKDSIYEFNNGSYNLVFSEEIAGGKNYGICGLRDDCIYYELNDKPNELYEYDLNLRKTTNQINLAYFSRNYSDFNWNIEIFLDDRVVVRVKDKKGAIFSVDISSGKIEKIYEYDGTIRLNGYGDNLYFSLDTWEETDHGAELIGGELYKLDADNELKKIYNGDVEGIYILDKEWVYIVGSGKNLYRVSADGENLEKVFG